MSEGIRPASNRNPAAAAGAAEPAQPVLSRSAKIIGAVSLLSDVSTEMAYPLLPAFITQVLGAPAAALGLIEGLAQGTASIVTGLSGWISDRIARRKAVAVFGYILTAISKPVIAAASLWSLVLGARFADRFGKGIRTAPRDALLAESSAEQHRGRAFGFERAMDSTGAVVGPLIALALVGWASFGTRFVLAVSTLPAAVAVLLMMLIREKRDQVVTGPKSLRLSLAGTTSEYRTLMLIVAVFGLGNSANAFLILRAERIGLSLGYTILAYALYNAIAALAAMPAGTISDKFGRRNVLVAGYSIYAIVYFGFALVTDSWLVWPLFALYGLFPALTEGVAKALAVDTAGLAGRGTAVGIYSSVVGVTQIAASYIAGLLWDARGPAAAFHFGGVLAASAAVMLVMLLPAHAAKNTKKPVG